MADFAEHQCSNRFHFFASILTPGDWLRDYCDMKITGKGQLTIPPRLGKKHGLKPGADVILIDQPNGLLIVNTAGLSKGQRVVETLLRGGPLKGRTEDWLRLTRGEP
jgi:bifunctional DNA-binding transcriptional regulator/antitoxin component of YhaV-PrlF toxin-antitoxin module